MLVINSESIIIGLCLSFIITECFGYYIFESKMLSLLFYCFVGIYFYGMLINKNRKVELKEPHLNSIEGYRSSSIKFKEFESSDSFQGRRDGYVFKSDTEGLGYYLDK